MLYAKPPESLDNEKPFYKATGEGNNSARFNWALLGRAGVGVLWLHSCCLCQGMGHSSAWESTSLWGHVWTIWDQKTPSGRQRCPGADSLCRARTFIYWQQSSVAPGVKTIIDHTLKRWGGKHKLVPQRKPSQTSVKNIEYLSDMQISATKCGSCPLLSLLGKQQALFCVSFWLMH